MTARTGYRVVETTTDTGRVVTFTLYDTSPATRQRVADLVGRDVSASLIPGKRYLVRY